MLLPWQHQTPQPKFYHITKLPNKFKENYLDMEGLSQIVWNCELFKVGAGIKSPPPSPPPSRRNRVKIFEPSFENLRDWSNRSKAFVRLMNTSYRYMFCSMLFSWTCLMANTMSMVFRLRWNHTVTRGSLLQRCLLRRTARRCFCNSHNLPCFPFSLRGDDRSISKLLRHVFIFPNAGDHTVESF